MRSMSLITAMAITVSACTWFRPPRYITDPALVEADAGARRGDADDRAGLRRLAAVPGFPKVADPTDPAQDAALAAATVAVGAATADDSGPKYDQNLQSAVKFVLRRRRRAAFHAIAVALRDPIAEHRRGALWLLSDAYVPCRGRDGKCAGWPEREELAQAVRGAATSDPDASVRRIAVNYALEAPRADVVLAALDRESDEDVRHAWFRLAAGGPNLAGDSLPATAPSAEAGVDLAQRAAADGAIMEARDLLKPHLIAPNRALLEEAYRRGNTVFRRAVAAAIWERQESLPWAEWLIEQGLFDEHPDVRADFAGDVRALDSVSPALRARLQETAAVWESSRNALAFLRAQEAGRPWR